MPYSPGSYNRPAPKGSAPHNNPAPDMRKGMVMSGDKTKDLFRMDSDMIKNAPWYKDSQKAPGGGY